MQVPLICFYNKKVKTGMDIFIRSGKIYDIQPTGTKEFKNAAIVIPGEEFYAMPGFINTHTHLWQHLPRSVSPSSQLQEWIPGVYRPVCHMTDEEFYKLNYAACLTPGATFSLKKELGGKPVIFTVSTDAGFEKTIEITLPNDPVWDWALRANVYVETKFDNYK